MTSLGVTGALSMRSPSNEQMAAPEEAADAEQLTVGEDRTTVTRAQNDEDSQTVLGSDDVGGHTPGTIVDTCAVVEVKTRRC